MLHKNLLQSIVLSLLWISCGSSSSLTPSEGPHWGVPPAVAAEVGIVEKVPHEPDLGHGEAVDHHEVSVEAGVKCLEVGSSGRPRDAERAEPLVSGGLDADALQAHAEEDIVDGEQLHLQGTNAVRGGKIRDLHQNTRLGEPVRTCRHAELSLRAVYPDMTNPPPPA